MILAPPGHVQVGVSQEEVSLHQALVHVLLLPVFKVDNCKTLFLVFTIFFNNKEYKEG